MNSSSQNRYGQLCSIISPPEAIDLRRIQSVNEFYKKGCQEKVSARPDAEKIFVSRSSPLPVSVPPRFAREGSLWPVCHFRGFHLPVATTPIES
jgi:hypothetical protein